MNSCLNTVVSDDSRVLQPLTPNYLLSLKPDSPMPRSVFRKEDFFSWHRSRQIQYLSDIFWKRWSNEYLACYRAVRSGCINVEIWQLETLFWLLLRAPAGIPDHSEEFFKSFWTRGVMFTESKSTSSLQFSRILWTSYSYWSRERNENPFTTE